MESLAVPCVLVPPEWKWLFATLQRYNVKHKHNQGKRVANGIACSKEGGNATSTLHSRGSPNKGGQNQKSKAPPGVTMMPLGAPSISKYGSLVRPDAQIVALRAHCARTSRALHMRRPHTLGSACVCRRCWRCGSMPRCLIAANVIYCRYHPIGHKIDSDELNDSSGVDDHDSDTDEHSGLWKLCHFQGGANS